MRIKSITLTMLAAALLVCLAISGAYSQQYAVAAGSNSVYMLTTGSGWNGQNAIPLSGISGSNIKGIASKDNRIYLIDRVNDIGVLKIYDVYYDPSRMTEPQVNKVADIDLEVDGKQIYSPGAITVTDNGSIYISEGTSSTAAYAYISANGSSYSNVSITNLNSDGDSYYSVTDIAAFNSNSAIMGHRNGSGVLDQGYVTNSEGFTTNLGDNAFKPVAITVFPDAIANRRVAYVLNEFAKDEQFSSRHGSISAVDAETMQPIGGAALLDNEDMKGFKPIDIQAFSYNSINYLAVLAKSYDGTKHAAWRFSLDSTTPVTTGYKTFSGIDPSGFHQGAVSYDQSIFWITNPDAGTIQALNTGTWDSFNSYDIGSSLYYISDFENLAVPEPSGLVALASFAVGAFGLRFRRR